MGIERNPRGSAAGRNQFSYRRDFETAIQGLAEGKYTGRIQDNDDLDAKCWYCLLTRCEEQAAGIGPVHSACLEHVRKMTRIGESVRPGSAGRLGLEELR